MGGGGGGSKVVHLFVSLEAGIQSLILRGGDDL